MNRLVVQPCQGNHGETLVLVDPDSGEVLAESPIVWDYTEGDGVAAAFPASENVYGELFALFAVAPELRALLIEARELIERAPMPHSSPSFLFRADEVLKACGTGEGSRL